VPPDTENTYLPPPNTADQRRRAEKTTRPITQKPRRKYDQQSGTRFAVEFFNNIVRFLYFPGEE